MSGYARILISDEGEMWVRFERIGRGGKFDLLLDAFRTSFPLASWDEQRKSWKLLASQLEQVVSFCNSIGLRKKFEDYDTIARNVRQSLLH